MSIRIRPFTPGDYETAADLHNAVWPDNRESEEETRHWDRLRPPEHAQERWIAEWDGRPVGVGAYYHMEWMYHPRKFGLWIDVAPDSQGRGIGRALYGTVLRAVSERDPILLRTMTRADRPRSIRFLADRGFEEEERAWESRLDVAAFDFAPFEDAEPRVLAQGIGIHTYSQLSSRPDHLRRLYEACMEIDREIPAPEPITTPTFQRWKQMSASDPNLLPDGQFIATDGDEYVAVSTLWNSRADDDLHTGITGVRRSWRRKGIALALKIRAIAYARERGSAFIRTDNSSLNLPMLSINERLGFVKQPAWISYRKTMKAE